MEYFCRTKRFMSPTVISGTLMGYALQAKGRAGWMPHRLPSRNGQRPSDVRTYMCLRTFRLVSAMVQCRS